MNEYHITPDIMNRIIFIILILFLYASALPVSGSVQSDAISGTYGSIAHEHLSVLAEDIGARPAGSIPDAQAAEYILDTFKKAGYVPIEQPFTFFDEDGARDTSANIISLHRGESDEEIILGAHYDSTADGKGADDNGSGIGVLLETAERLSSVNTFYTIRFIAFGAEECELDGSWYYLNQLSEEEKENIVAFINIDGLIAGNNLYLYGDSGNDVYDMIAEYANSGLILLPAESLEEDDGYMCDCGDFYPFHEEEIPFVFIEATDWTEGDLDGWTQVDPSYGEDGIIRHTRYDTLDYINSSFPGRIEERLGIMTQILFETLI